MATIKLKYLLLTEAQLSNPITPRDIYNFYFLFTVAEWQPALVQTNYGKHVMDTYLQALQKKYLKMFSEILFQQISKYVERQRIDPDFPTSELTPDASPSTLLKLIQKTFRTDMKRRNDSWIMVADYLNRLSNASNAKEKRLYINQLNACVHNTGTSVLDKIDGFYQGGIKKALDVAAEIGNIEHYKSQVDKEIRDLLNQSQDSSTEQS